MYAELNNLIVAMAVPIFELRGTWGDFFALV
jgi:hypothetical protein